ncbi:MAG: ATP synthase F1 subunit delta [Saccharofermentans sp.]|nr:ATP synthase F1 subunit delta [Saccharofermentans sp.]
MNGNAKEYALAMFAIALENNSIAEIHDDFLSLREAFDDNTGFMEYLINPAIPKSERFECLREVFESRVCDDVFSFLNIICEHGDSYTILPTIDEFEAMYEEYMRYSKAVVTSAIELSDDQKRRLISKLQAVTGKRIEAEYIIDKSLIGGLAVTVDGKHFDGSVRKNLKNIKEEIS